MAQAVRFTCIAFFQGCFMLGAMLPLNRDFWVKSQKSLKKGHFWTPQIFFFRFFLFWGPCRVLKLPETLDQSLISEIPCPYQLYL